MLFNCLERDRSLRPQEREWFTGLGFLYDGISPPSSLNSLREVLSFQWWLSHAKGAFFRFGSVKVLLLVKLQVLNGLNEICLLYRFIQFEQLFSS